MRCAERGAAACVGHRRHAVLGARSMASVQVAARARGRWLLTWPLWPQALLLLAFFVVPVLFIAHASLHDKTGAVTGMNYFAFFVDAYDRAVILRTLLIGVATTVVTLILGYPLARIIARGSATARWIVSGAVFFPLLTSSVIRSFGWLVLLADNGLLNDALQYVGIPGVHLVFNSAGVTLALAQ